MEKLKAKLKNLKENNVKVNEIDTSQRFVSAEYDDLMKVNKRLREKVDQMEKDQNKLTTDHNKLANKTEHIFNYSHWDHVIFLGVPKCHVRGQTEDCKQMIVDICRELHYNIPMREISTAHRLK